MIKTPTNRMTFVKFSNSFLLTFFLILSSNNFAQNKTNLELFNTQLDSAVSKVINNLPSNVDTINLNLTLGNSYSIFENRIIADFNSMKKQVQLNTGHFSNFTEVNFVIENATVTYGEMFRKSLFGTFYLQRILNLKGSFAILKNATKVHNFNFSTKDTVKVSDINQIENNSYPFTKGKVPSEPFFANLYEPVIAIGTAAVAIYLFFTIRSK